MVLRGININFEEFVRKSKEVLIIGREFNNPGGGTSTIISVGDNVRYRRGKSTISISIDELYKAYISFKGKQCITKDLRAYAPAIFDSAARPAGHSCNCTFLFMLLHEIGLANEIKDKVIIIISFIKI